MIEVKRVHLVPDGVALTDENVRIWTEILVGGFLLERNPIMGIQAFLYSRQARVDVPEAILDWLTECLQKYWDGNGTKSLDDIMGLLPIGSGKSAPFKIAMLNERDETLLMDMMRLKCHGVKIMFAAEMVWRRLQETKDWDKTGWNLPIPVVETLVQKYKRWPLRNEIERRYKQEIVPKTDPSEIVAFFRQFPHFEDYLPAHQKPFFKKSFVKAKAHPSNS
jgi:hypothetical protein